jgi:hypothetical protein
MPEERSLPLPRPTASVQDQSPAAATAGQPEQAAVPAAAPPAAGAGESPLASQLPRWDLLPPASPLLRRRPAR